MSDPGMMLGRGAPLREMIERSRSGVVAVDSSGKIVFSNSAILQILGYDRPLEGRHLRTVLPVDAVRSTIRGAEDLAIQGGHHAPGVNVDTIVKRADGTDAPVQLRLIDARDLDTAVAMVAVDDISERVRAEERNRAVARSYQTLAGINEAIIRAQDLDELYRETCRIAVEEGGYVGAWIGVFEDDGLRLVASAGGLEEMAAQMIARRDPQRSHGRGPSMEAVSRGESTWITDLASDPRVATWSDIVAQHHVRAAATVPLLRDGRPVAVLALFSDRAGDLDLEMRGLIEHVAANVSFALDALAATAGLRTVAAHRRELLERLATAQESERQRIAGDIHDDSVQTLAAVELRLSLLGRQVPDADSERLVWSLREQVSHVISGLRDLLFELEPAHLDRGLPDLADEACHYLLGPHGIQWDVEMDRVPRLGDTQHLQLVRILKEALTNVVKHARATRVKVAFTSDEHELTMLVEDDGTGLSSGGILGGAGHRGVQTMHDRAEAAGGRCRIEGSPSGTTVTVWLPIEADAL